MSSSVCSPGQGLHCIPSLRKRWISIFHDSELAWEDAARHFGGVGRMRQSPLRSLQGGGSPVIHQCSTHPELQDEAQGTRSRAGVPQPSASPHHSFHLPTHTHHWGLAWVFLSLPFCPPQENAVSPKSSESLSSHPCLSRA